ncbi:restriction endonuclease subunit S [Enterococcus durans]|uniref:Restriction endonuclease subunit S n=1 Tax=Enterococcus durans TaxID=53345 RepID=A0A5N0YPJ4_9ENTE|nr:restriction endonuclease subunit S [Enterococcus durans]KAA9177800.1 restriction endonuclease subunit S [Enterococcus durans]KAA9183721.1 restriction endonuclease subunit S [Enterococcus durans]KAA9184843.1 restriction endonuclease subunit S [Enterococcus durans]KAA9189529.1 restriction endonuclease subunit S [Enterococcus durans]KAA9191990.1 restriction endonuclease subunit S [Enterococcus durans]
MSNDTRPRPEIRFPGFTEAWEQSKLGEVAEYYDGTHQTPKYTKSGIPFVSVENIQNILGTGKYISEDDFETNFKIKPKKNDILMTRITAGIIGDTAIITNDSPLAYYVSLALIRSKKINFLYLEKYINTPYFKHELHKRIIHTAFPKKINLVEIGQCSVSYPKKESEQKQIGQFFIQLDKSIALHQRKLDLLKETKKGFLQKMFPKNGAKVPEIRFSGFTEDWEQRKLGEIVQITMGQSPNSENYTENPEDYILVQGNADMKNNRVVPRVWTTQITKQAEKGDLILSVRAPVGDIGKTDYDVVLGRGVAAIKGNDFIFQQLGKMKESGYWNRFSTGSTFESIKSNDIREALITIPTGEEQQKIGTFFKQLDDTIALHQRKLDLLKETKKGFLQKMFV